MPLCAHCPRSQWHAIAEAVWECLVRGYVSEGLDFDFMEGPREQNILKKTICVKSASKGTEYYVTLFS